MWVPMRRTYAALLCFVWLLGVEVLPSVHLASHATASAHEHAPDGTVVTVTFDRDAEPHRHDDGTVHAGHPSDLKVSTTTKKKRPPIGVLAFNRVPDLHVASGLAHRALALHGAPLTLVDTIVVDRVATDIIDIARGRDTLAFVATADARGPPQT